MKVLSSALAAISLFASLFAFAENEANLRGRFDAINRHLQEGATSTFKSRDGLRIAYHVNQVQNEKGAVVFVSGRTESFIKYAELIYDLNQQGYSVYSFDHRGQGLSEGRLNDDREKGYIADFDLYVGDMELFVNKVVAQRGSKRLYLLAHSLGGLVSTRYVQKNPKHPFRAIALSSPAFGLVTGHKDIVVDAVTCLNLHPKAYARGKGPADHDEPFENNPLTSSRVRHDFYLSQMNGDPREITGNPRMMSEPAMLGGPTNKWVCETLHATYAAKRNARHIQVPILIEGADNDQIVRVEDEREFCGNARNCRFTLNHAKHETLIERDEIRDRVFARILGFFAKN